MNNGKSGKNLLIVSLIIVMLFMIVGYASVITMIRINGSGTIMSSWNVGITSVSENKSASTISKKTNYSNDGMSSNFSFNVEFINPGDYIDYKITVANNGTIDARISSITPKNTNEMEIGGISFSLIGISVGDKISVGEEITFTVRAEWHNDNYRYPEITEKDYRLKVNFTQV